MGVSIAGFTAGEIAAAAFALVSSAQASRARLSTTSNTAIGKMRAIDQAPAGQMIVRPGTWILNQQGPVRHDQSGAEEKG
jgi:hypothetical protein